MLCQSLASRPLCPQMAKQKAKGDPLNPRIIHVRKKRDSVSMLNHALVIIAIFLLWLW